MPRVSRDTRERILDAARQQLMKSPEEQFSMRRIASLCGISAGTIYNHFPDKDSLIAAVMIEDWHKALAEMESAGSRAESFGQGISAIYHAISSFIARYENIWLDYRAAGNYASVQNRRHKELIDEISGHVRKLLERFAGEKDHNMDRILSENILTAALQREVTLDTLLQLASYIAK